jgi:hypothetical protein
VQGSLMTSSTGVYLNGHLSALIEQMERKVYISIAVVTLVWSTHVDHVDDQSVSFSLHFESDHHYH